MNSVQKITLLWMVLCLAIIGSGFTGMVNKDHQIAALKAQVTTLKASRDSYAQMSSALKELVAARNLEIDRLRHSDGPCLKGH